MNQLNGMRFYQSGAIDRVADAGVGWRNAITPILEKMGIVVMDPCKKPINDMNSVEGPDFQSLKKQLKKDGNFQELSRRMKLIRNIDLRMVDAADALIVNLDMDVHLCGTYEEIFLANRQKKPILIMCPQGISAIPDWLFGTLPLEFMFHNWPSMVDYLRYVDSGMKVNSRWIFWSFDKQKVETTKNLDECGYYK